MSLLWAATLRHYYRHSFFVILEDTTHTTDSPQFSVPYPRCSLSPRCRNHPINLSVKAGHLTIWCSLCFAQLWFYMRNSSKTKILTSLFLYFVFHAWQNKTDNFHCNFSDEAEITGNVYTLLSRNYTNIHDLFNGD